MRAIFLNFEVRDWFKLILVFEKMFGLKDLSVGLNSEKVVLGRVICSVYSEETVPFTFCIMDLEETVTVVTLYNLSPGRGVIIGQ